MNYHWNGEPSIGWMIFIHHFRLTPFTHIFFKDPFVGKVCGFLRRLEVTKSAKSTCMFLLGQDLVKKNHSKWFTRIPTWSFLTGNGHPWSLLQQKNNNRKPDRLHSPTPFFRFHVKNQTRKPRVSLVFLVFFSRFWLKSTIAYPQPTHESSTGSPRMKR